MRLGRRQADSLLAAWRSNAEAQMTARSPSPPSDTPRALALPRRAVPPAMVGPRSSSPNGPRPARPVSPLKERCHNSLAACYPTRCKVMASVPLAPATPRRQAHSPAYPRLAFVAATVLCACSHTVPTDNHATGELADGGTPPAPPPPTGEMPETFKPYVKTIPNESEVVSRLLPRIRRCLPEAAPGGFVLVLLQVDTTGRVTTVRAPQTTPEILSCIESQAKTARFAPPVNAQPAAVWIHLNPPVP